MRFVVVRAQASRLRHNCKTRHSGEWRSRENLLRTLNLSYESGPTANAFRRRPSAGGSPTPQLQNLPFWRVAFLGKPSSLIGFELRGWACCYHALRLRDALRKPTQWPQAAKRNTISCSASVCAPVAQLD